MTSLSWFAVLQSLISAGLVAVLWVLHARLGRLPFFLWWGWAWTVFALYLLLGALTLPLSATWTPAIGTLAFLATIFGYLQPALLMVGVASLRSSTMPVRTWRTLGIASALTAGDVSLRRVPRGCQTPSTASPSVWHRAPGPSPPPRCSRPWCLSGAGEKRVRWLVR